MMQSTTQAYEQEIFVSKSATTGFSYEFRSKESSEVVVYNDEELKMLSLSFYQEVHVTLQTNFADYHCACWDALCVRIHCAKEELKGFFLCTIATLKGALRCIKEAIAHGICWAVEASAHLLASLKLKIDCILDEIKETAIHVFVRLGAFFHSLKLKILSGWAMIKINACLAVAKLRDVCRAFEVEINFKFHQFKRALKQVKCYLRSVFHRAVDKIKAGFVWVKAVWKALKSKLHHCKETFLSDCHRACLDVLLPCMDKDVIAKLSLCHTDAQAACQPFMWKNFTIHSSLWTLSKKKSCTQAVEQVLEWTELHQYMQSVTVSCKEVTESSQVEATHQVASHFFKTMATSDCGVKPYLVTFKDVTIRSEWALHLKQVKTVKRIQPKRCQYEHSDLYSEMYSSFSINYEELNSSTALSLLHSQVKSLTVVVKTGQKIAHAVEDRFVTVRNAVLREFTLEELTEGSELKVAVEKYHREVVSNNHVQSLHLEKIKIEFVARTTKKVIRVTCPPYC